MGQGKSAHGEHRDRSSRHSVSKPQKKQISLENAIRPNGFMPPELVFSLMNMVDFDTYRVLAITCKLWYETAQTTVYGSNLSLVGTNMMKGYWWTETLSNRFSPKFNFSYVASFQGNKVIVNNHHINPTSYGNYKFYKDAFMVDLTSNARTTVPYGCHFANDYIVKCLKEGNDDYFDWDSLEVLDKNLKVLHKIERKNKAAPPPDNGGWGYASPVEIISLHVNQKPGENSIILVNTPFSYHAQDDDKPESELIIEEFNLKSAKMTSEHKIEAKKILGYHGNHVIVSHKDKVTVYDMSSHKESTLTADCKNPVFSIHENEIAVRSKLRIRFFSLESHKEIREIDIAPHLKPIPDGPGTIRSLAFDKTKLVVGVDNNSGVVHLVVGLASSNLLAFMHCPYDKVAYCEAPRVHMAPNGKIVTDASNLNIYDFSHPNANPELKVPIIYFKDDKVQQTSIKLLELKQYTMQKFNVPLDRISMRMLEGPDPTQLRATLLFLPNGYYGDHNVLSTLFSSWEASQVQRSAWQITTNVPQEFSLDLDHHNLYTGEEYDRVYEFAKEAVILFERFNTKKNRWEFCEPTGIDDSKVTFD